MYDISTVFLLIASTNGGFGEWMSGIWSLKYVEGLLNLQRITLEFDVHQ
jgi:hypothetical protein